MSSECSTLSYAGQGCKWNSAEDAESIAKSIKNIKELKCLKLEGNTLGVEAAQVIGNELAGHPEFERAHWKDLFTGRLKTEIPEALKCLFSGIRKAGAKLVELDLSDNALGPVGVEGMVEFIKSPSCYSLKELRLNNNGLGIKGGTMLAEALLELAENAESKETPFQLKIFIAGRNRLENPGAKIFSQVFSKVKSLEEIAMPQNGIFHKGIAALAKSFSLNPNLQIVNLNDNTFTPKGARAMAEELPNMRNLEVINFGDCLLKTAGALSIASALKDHTKLRELYMDSNEIREIGGVAIINAVCKKPNISHVMLDTNEFGESGAENLIQMLREIGKEDILGSLEDNEDPDEEEEEEDEDEDEEDDDDDEEEEEEATSEEDYDNDENEDEIKVGVSPLKRDKVLQPIKCTTLEFVESPNAARLLGLSDPVVPSFLEEAKSRANDPNRDADLGEAGTPEALIHEYVRLFMTVSSLSTSENKQVLDIVEMLSKELARRTFEVAEENDILSVATNCILVHFGLVKSESKKFTIAWDLRGCMISLTQITSADFFPESTKSTLQFFFSKPDLPVDRYVKEKYNLTASLFR